MVQIGLEHPFLHESIKIHVLSTGTTSSPIYGYCITEVCISFEEYNCWPRFGRCLAGRLKFVGGGGKSVKSLTSHLDLKRFTTA